MTEVPERRAPSRQATASRWRREERTGSQLALVLSLHVQPGAKRTEVVGLHGDLLKIRLAAPAQDGKANAELVRFLATAFGVRQRAVTLLHGAESRKKSVRIAQPVERPDRHWSKAAPSKAS
jgi:uncharacterized protein